MRSSKRSRRLTFVYLIINILFVANVYSTETIVSASDIQTGDNFGCSVDISGNYLIAGAQYEDHDSDGLDALTSSGSAYIYFYNGSSWSQQNKLIANERAAEDFFGCSVGISGDYAIVGAENEEEDENEQNRKGDSGSAFIFERNGTDWSLLQKIVASDRFSNSYFGTAVDIDGNYIIVGALRKDAQFGAAYIFYFNGSTWVQQAKITADDGAQYDHFGNSVSIKGDYAVVGAVDEDHDSDGLNSLVQAGSAYVFMRSGESWSQQAKLTASDREINDKFGYSVSISENYCAVGTVAKNTETGAAYIFERNGSAWTQQAKITASDATTLDLFGTVAISGDSLFVGADADSRPEDAFYNSGSGYFYIRSGTEWIEKSIVPDYSSESHEHFGCSVAIDGGRAVAGAYIGSNNAGQVYIYETVSDLSLPVEISSFTARSATGQIILEWATESETENLGFILERRLTADNGHWNVIANYIWDENLLGQGSTTYRTNYSYADNKVEPGIAYDYRLADIDYRGEKKYFDSILVGVEAVNGSAGSLQLLPAFPNPSNPETTIQFSLPAEMDVTLIVYGISGVEIARLIEGRARAGRMEVVWNGRNSSGSPVASGIYFYRLTSSNISKTGKLVLLR